MIEIEIKAMLDTQISSEILESATDLGFEVCWRGVEEDVYYNGNDRDFRQTDEALGDRNDHPDHLQRAERSRSHAVPHGT